LYLIDAFYPRLLPTGANKKHQLSTTKYCMQSGLLTTFRVSTFARKSYNVSAPRPLCARSNYAIKLIM